MFRRNFKKTVATIAAATMVMTTLSATVSAVTTTTAVTATASTGALANVKYSDTLIPLQTTYNAAQLTTVYNYTGDLACKDGGDVVFMFDSFNTKDFEEKEFVKAVITFKSNSTTATITLVSDEDAEDEDNYVYYSEELEKLFTTPTDYLLTVNVKDLSETLTTMIRTNSKLTVGTTPITTGMLWDDATTGWTVNKTRVIDSCTVTLVAEQSSESAPTKKDMSALVETMETTTMTVSGDVREYTINDNKLYLAGKYDSDLPDATLTGDALTQKTMLESITAYADFIHYIELCDTNGYTVTKDNAGINDYVKNYLVLQGYRASLEGRSDNALTDYWYDSWTEETPTGVDVTTGTLAGAYDTTAGNIVVRDIRDSANDADFRVIRNSATASSGTLNTYIVSKGYPAVVANTTYGYADATDYTTINTFAQLTTALTNVTGKLTSIGKMANTSVNTRGGIVNTTNKAVAVAEARSSMTVANTWVNVGTMYCTDTGYPVLAQLNTIIGENRGVKVRFNVDPKTVTSTTASTSQVGAFNTAMSTAGAARLRVNGLYATNLSAVASYDSTNNCFEFDWDAVAGDTKAVWMLELATYDAVGLTNIDIRIPDQEAYLAAIGGDTDSSDTPEQELQEDSTDSTSNKSEINYGEGVEQDSDTIDETPIVTDKPNNSTADVIDGIINELGNTTDITDLDSLIDAITDKMNSNTNNTIDVTVSDDNSNSDSDNETEFVNNPSTGETGAACFATLGTLFATICGRAVVRKRK